MLNIRKTAFFVFFLKKTFRNACPCEGGYVKLTSMERDLRPLVRPVSKGRFLNVTCLWFSNFATLNPRTAVMQQRRLRGLILYLPAAIIPLYIYNKVYTPTKVHALCVYIPGVDSVDMYILELLWPWCVYIIAGVGRLYVAYPFSWGQCEGLKIKG